MFACFNSLWAHVVVCHPNKENNYQCPDEKCLKKINCTDFEIEEHFKHDHDFKEFQCIYCTEGFNDVSEARIHMSNQHESNFLFIGARRSAKPEDDEKEVQIVYIGNSLDYHKFSLSKCSKLEELDAMNPAILDFQTQFDFLQQQQNVAIKEAFTGTPPSIRFVQTNDDFFITYDNYVKLRRRRTSKCAHSVNEATEIQTKLFDSQQTPEPNIKPIVTPVIPEPEVQNLPSFQPPLPNGNMKTSSSHPIKFEIGQIKRDPHQIANTAAPLTDDEIKITYKCINIKTADELENIEGSKYKSLLCPECSQFLKIDEKTGVGPYIRHLMDVDNNHPCNHSDSIEKYMMQHRIGKHADSPIIYLQEERTSTTLVYKLVRCMFKCLSPDCNEQFQNVPGLRKHHSNHNNRYLRSTVIRDIKVIQSNDRNQEVNSCINESYKYFLCNLYWCNRHNIVIGSRIHLLKHHNDEHQRHNFECSMRTLLVENFTMANDDHIVYVLECEHCLHLFPSTESVNAHIEQIRSVAPDTAYYTIKRLLACPEDKIISTYSGLDAHYSAMHPDKMCTPVHPFNQKLCGLCRTNVKESDLESHYKQAHKKGEVVGCILLRQLKLDKFDLANCIFSPGCCAAIKLSKIAQVIVHLSACKERLTCMECDPNQTFEQLQNLAKHRLNIHGESLEMVVAYFKDIKRFTNLLRDMRIIFPSGFVVTKQAIEDTQLGGQLCNEISQPINDLFGREEAWLKTYLSLDETL